MRALMTRNDVDKYAELFKGTDAEGSALESISFDDIKNQELQQTSDELSAFFGIEGLTVESFATDFVESMAEEVSEKSKTVSVENLTARTAEENEARYEESKYIFKRNVAEEKEKEKEKIYTVDPIKTNPDLKLASDLYNQQNSFNRNVGTNTNRFANNVQKPQTAKFGSTGIKDSEKTGKAIEAFPNMNIEVQKLARQSIKGWNEKEKVDDFEQFSKNVPWYKKLLRKVKNFFKTKKSKVTIKVAMLLALNMAMSVFSKRYEFEDKKQMVGMFSFMMGSFLISRELSEEGLDLGNFGI